MIRTFLSCFLLLVNVVFLNAIEIGNTNLGGSIRANYVLGDYVKTGTGAAQRGGDGGNMVLDVFTVKAKSNWEHFETTLEYRWYNGYNFFHTAMLEAKAFGGSMKLGVTRVPFGVGAFGPANSWFFDQHFYLGLADDMDLGVHFSKNYETLSVDMAYFFSSEWQGKGASTSSSRYGYDIVNENNKNGLYEEEHQLNLRIVKSVKLGFEFHPGASVQYGQLSGINGLSEDSDALAIALHTKINLSQWTFLIQGTHYYYDAQYSALAKTTLGVDDDLIGMGAYDFAWPVASKGRIFSTAIAYTWKDVLNIAESVTLYHDYSLLIKDGDLAGKSFNDSALSVIGLSIANKGWYIYVDHGFSNGNYFVGNEGDNYSNNDVGDFGVNGNNKWNKRLNINFGYYF